jgi:hypothetical protein
MYFLMKGNIKNLGKFPESNWNCIYRDVVFIIDSRRNKIKTFTCNGKYLFGYKSDKFIGDNILIINDKVYFDYNRSAHIS